MQTGSGFSISCTIRGEKDRALEANYERKRGILMRWTEMAEKMGVEK